MKIKYTIDGLDCPNCAMKVEKAIAELEGVENVVLNFPTKTLTLKSDMESEELFILLKRTINSVEDGTILSPQLSAHHPHKHDHTNEHNHTHVHDDCDYAHDYSVHYHNHHNSGEWNCKYTIDGLDCPNCAMKVEKAIAELEGVENVVLNFPTKTLTLKSDMESEELFTLLKRTIDSVEDGVSLTRFESEKISCENEKKPFNKNMVNWVCISVSLLLLVAGFIVSICDAPDLAKNILMAAAAAVAGIQIVWSGIKSALHKRLDERVLMAVAVLAAVCIGEFFEAAMVSVLSLIGDMLENHAVEISRRDIAKLSDIRPDTAAVVCKNGNIEVENADEVDVGTTILIRPHERIPLDGVVEKGVSALDTSAITGESVPRDISAGGEVMSGMMNLDGELYVRTTRLCEDSAAARILRLVEESATHKGKSEKFISRFAAVYTPIVMICAILLMVLPPVLGVGQFLDWFNRALVFLVASCPCALVISVPLGFYAGIGAASKKGVLIKGGKFIEVLAKADAAAFDKTGTLTSGKLSVSSIKARGKHTENEVLALAAAAEKLSAHPVAQAVVGEAQKRGLDLPVLVEYREKAGCGVEAKNRNSTIRCGGRRLFDDECLEDGIVYLAVDGEIIGEIQTSDTLRSDSAAVVKKLKKTGLKKLVMLTGDSEEEAGKIAKQCGLDEYHAGLLPQDKAEWVKNLHKDYTVLFVGDGINDAPVLAGADCGIAMGFGSEAAIEAADAVLSSGGISGLPEAIDISRRIMAIIRTNIVFALSVKAVILILAVLGVAPMWLAVLADTGVSVLSVLNSVRILR